MYGGNSKTCNFIDDCANELAPNENNNIDDKVKYNNFMEILWQYRPENFKRIEIISELKTLIIYLIIDLF